VSRTPAQIRAELSNALLLSGLDDLINDAIDEARRQPGKRNRTPDCKLAEFIYDTLTDVKTAAEQFVAVLAEQEAQAERIAEEADRQYEQTWGAFVAGITSAKGAA
jgi:hypothetical protein